MLKIYEPFVERGSFVQNKNDFKNVLKKTALVQRAMLQILESLETEEPLGFPCAVYTSRKALLADLGYNRFVNMCQHPGKLLDLLKTTPKERTTILGWKQGEGDGWAIRFETSLGDISFTTGRRDRDIQKQLREHKHDLWLKAMREHRDHVCKTKTENRRILQKARLHLQVVRKYGVVVVAIKPEVVTISRESHGSIH